jgi:transposase
MRAFLTKHGYSGRRPPGELLARLHAAPAGLVGTPEVEARRDAVLALVGVLRARNTSIKQPDRSVVAHLAEHPDAEIFTSLPRSGRISAAQVLAEWGDCRQAYDHPDAVAALSGIVPVTKTSGKHRTVSFRWACNKRLRAAITGWADNSRHQSPWAAKVDADAVTRGCDHPHAVRILARAWVRVIWRCWVDHTPYDPAKHTTARRLTEIPDSAA